jgi:hypothetical protein
MKYILSIILVIAFSFQGCKKDEKQSPKTEICNNGVDDDGDGFIDCSDFDCINTTLKECNCSDGIDNDNDGFIDEADFDC